VAPQFIWYDMRMNKKSFIIMISILFALGVAIFFCVKQWEADSPNYVPGSITVTFKPEYRQDRMTIEAVAKSVGGTVDYDGGIHDMGWYWIHVKVGKEEEAVTNLSTKPEVESAYRDVYHRVD
jgi:hypothetical protein